MDKKKESWLRKQFQTFAKSTTWKYLAIVPATIETIFVVLIGIVIEVVLILVNILIAVKTLPGAVKKSWQRAYHRMLPAGPCEICHKTGGQLEWHSCCKRWTHFNCHAAETLEKLIKNMSPDVPFHDESASMMGSQFVH